MTDKSNMKIVTAIFLNFLFFLNPVANANSGLNYKNFTRKDLAKENARKLRVYLSQKFKSEKDDLDLKKMEEKFAKLLPDLKIYRDKKVIKIGYQDLDLTLTDFDWTQKRFKINGKWAILNFEKGLKWNQQQILKIIIDKEVSFSPLELFIPSAHALVGKVALGILSFIVMAIAGNEIENQWNEKSLKKVLGECKDIKTEEQYMKQEFYHTYDKLMGKERYKVLEELFEKDQHCITAVDIVLKQQHDGSLAPAYDVECKILDDIYECHNDLKKKFSEAKGENFVPPKKKIGRKRSRSSVSN